MDKMVTVTRWNNLTETTSWGKDENSFKTQDIRTWRTVMPDSWDQNWGGSSTIALAYGYSIGRRTQVEPHALHELRRQNRGYEGSKVTRIHQTVYRLGAAQRGNSRDLRGCLEDAELSSDQCISVWKLPEAGKETSKAIEEMVLTRVPRIVLVSPKILIHGALGLRLVLP